MTRVRKQLTLRVVCLGCAVAAMRSVTAAAVPQDTWTGSGASANWSDGSNWSNGSPANYYGSLVFSASSNSAYYSNNNNLTGLNEQGILFNSSTAFTLGGNTITFYDYSGTQSMIENDGSATATVNLGPINFAATSGSNNWAEINAVGGDLSLGSLATVSLSGSDVAGLRIYGTGHTVTFNGAISGSGKYVAAFSGDTAVFNTANSYSGDTYVAGNSTLQLNATGALASGTFLRLGVNSDYTATAGTATATLGTSSGGTTISAGLVTAGSGTAGALTLNSTNTSGTNTWAGNIYLDNTLNVASVNTGGTFTLSASTIDLKSQTLNFGGAGASNVTGVLQSSTGAGTVNINLSTGGVATFSGDNAYTGTTTINSGTLRANTAGAGNSATGAGAVAINSGGTLGGSGYINNGTNAVAVNSGGTITAGANAASIGTLNAGNQVWNSGGKFAVKTAGNGASNDALIMSGLSISGSGAFTVSLTAIDGSTKIGSMPIVLATDTNTSQVSVFQNAITTGQLMLTTTLTAANGDSLKLAEIDPTGVGEELVAEDTAAPEPTSVVLLGLATLPLIGGRRRLRNDA